jgi:hypothetical protein
MALSPTGIAIFPPLIVSIGVTICTISIHALAIIAIIQGMSAALLELSDGSIVI